MNTSGQKDRVKGSVKKAIGATEAAMGKATKNKKMEQAGQKKEAEGSIQKGIGNVKGAVGDLADTVKKAAR